VSFLQVMFLLGSFAVAGPLIAHLLAKPRYRRVPFTMLRFLLVGRVESQSRRRFRDLLILLLRCAIIVLIAMLFARPRWLTEIEIDESRPVYYLGLDNSMSMAYSDGSGRYLDELVDSAVEYIRGAEDNGLFSICALGSQEWARDLSKDAALAEVGKLKVTAGTADIDNFVSVLAGARLQEKLERGISVLVLSDFTTNTLEQFADLSEPTIVGQIDCRAIVSPKPVSNAAVTSAHVTGSKDGKLVLNVSVANYGDVEQKRELTAKIGEKSSDVVDIKLPAGQERSYSVTTEIDLEERGTTFLPVELGLSAGDGLEEDDTFYLAISVPQRKSVNVLLVGEEDDTFLLKTAMTALSRMNAYEMVAVRQVSFGRLKSPDLGWADVVVCSAIAAQVGDMGDELESFVATGGKAVFFMTNEPSGEAAKKLWERGMLAALPGRRLQRQTGILPDVSGGKSSVGDNDAAAVKSLSHYRMERIVLTGYFECEQHADSVRTWELDNGLGLVYVKRLGNGTTILVNTSADDSLGALTKSSASVAFCGYLLGRNSEIAEHSFAYGEQAMVPASQMELKFAKDKQFWVQVCDGQTKQGTIRESFLFVPETCGIGWVRTLTKPFRYAGINLPEGETDMRKPTSEVVAGVTKRAFRVQEGEISKAEIFNDKGHKPIWKIFVWIIIAMLLIEPAIANRMKR